METKEIYAQLTPVFHDVFGDEELELRPELTANDVPEWDSLSHIRLILAVQKAFGLKFSASEIGKLKNVEGLVDLIRTKSS